MEFALVPAVDKTRKNRRAELAFRRVGQIVGHAIAAIAFFSVVYGTMGDKGPDGSFAPRPPGVKRLPQEYVAHQAAKVGLDAELTVCIAEHESRFRPDALGDSHLTCPMTGEPQRSRGLFQISDCWHPEVSDEVAFSITSSTEWALDRMQQGYAHEWSTYDRCKRLLMAKADLAESASPSSVGAD
jgi:hypothetical protein